MYGNTLGTSIQVQLSGFSGISDRTTAASSAELRDGGSMKKLSSLANPG